MSPMNGHVAVNYASEYLAASSGAGSFFEWLLLVSGAGAAGLYFKYRDTPDDWERFKKSLGLKKRGGKKDDTQPEPPAAPAPADGTAYVPYDEVEALVDRRVAEALAAQGGMTASVPIGPLGSIPQQRGPQRVEPVSFEKAPEGPQEPLEDEDDEEPLEDDEELYEAPQGPPQAPPVNKRPPVKERLVVPEVKKTTPAPAAASAPHITREDEPLEATPEEKELLEKLDPEVWKKNAPTRRLGETEVESAVLTRSGIQVMIRLDGDWTLPKFQAREESVRMLLEVRKDVMTRVYESDKSGWVILSLRTRSACPDFIPWYPGAPLGFCTVTGREIRFDFRRHLAIAGASNMGKSVTARNIFADVCRDAAACLIYCDPKMVEGALWRGRARVALDPDEIHEVALELDEENTRRKNVMQQRGWDSWIPSPDEPTLIVGVDEGASLVADAKDSSLEREERIERKKTLAIFTKGAREWRAQGIHIIWMTQYPTVEEGMPQQIGANIPDRISMALGMERHAEVVFDKENVTNGWKAHKLPRSPKGLALVKVGEDCEPNPIQVVYLDKTRISELPLSGIWYPSGLRYAKAVTDEPEELPEEATVYGDLEDEGVEYADEVEEDGTKVFDITTVSSPLAETIVVEQPEENLSSEDLVLKILLDATNPMTFAEVMAATGKSKPTLHRILTGLLNEGLVEKAGHNQWKVV